MIVASPFWVLCKQSEQVRADECSLGILLHQLSNTQYTVNAQGRTETWYRSLPHYVMAHLVYHWNRQGSKRKAKIESK